MRDSFKYKEGIEFIVQSRHVSWGPGVIFGVCCLLLPVCMRIVPETAGRELPQSIDQMNQYITSSYKIPSRRKNDTKA